MQAAAVIDLRLIRQQGKRNRAAMDVPPVLEPIEQVRTRVLEEMAAAPRIPHDSGVPYKVRFLSEGPEPSPP